MFSGRAGLSCEWRGGPTVSRGAREGYILCGERERRIQHSSNPSKFNPTRTWDLWHGMESRFVPVERWGEGDEFVIWKCIWAPHLKRRPALEHAGRDWCVSEESWQEENSCRGMRLWMHTCHLILPTFCSYFFLAVVVSIYIHLGRVIHEASNTMRVMNF